MVEGIPFAFKVEVFSDNELITTAELKEVTVNKEIFDFYFEKPKY
jgi:predicted thioesterase